VGLQNATQIDAMDPDALESGLAKALNLDSQLVGGFLSRSKSKAELVTSCFNLSPRRVVFGGEENIDEDENRTREKSRVLAFSKFSERKRWLAIRNKKRVVSSLQRSGCTVQKGSFLTRHLHMDESKDSVAMESHPLIISKNQSDSSLSTDGDAEGEADSFSSEDEVNECALQLRQSPLKPLEDTHFLHDLYKLSCEQEGVKPRSSIMKKLLLEHLCCSHQSFVGAELVALCKTLCESSFISSLDLSGCQIRFEGASTIGTLLSSQPRLISLNLSGAKMGSFHGLSFLSALAGCETLEILNLENNSLDSRWMERFATCSSFVASLKTLNLSKNRIGDDGLIAFANNLQGAMSFKEIDISWNLVRSKGAAHLFQAIVQERLPVESLNLSWNSIDDAACYEIAALIEHSVSLHCLLLKNNMLRKGTLEEICKVLPRTETLRSLFLGNNALLLGHKDGNLQLEAALLRNSSLRLLEIESVGSNVNHDYIVKKRKQYIQILQGVFYKQ